MNTVKTAPTNRRILVWVRDASLADKDGVRRGMWIPGRASEYPGLPKALHAEGYNGNWDIPFWSDFPSDPE